MDEFNSKMEGIKGKISELEDWKIEITQLYSREKTKMNRASGTSLVAQWIRLCAPNAGGPVSIPGQGTRSHMHATTKNSYATTKEPACHN